MDLKDPQDSDPKELKALRNIEFNEFQNWIKNYHEKSAQDTPYKHLME